MYIAGIGHLSHEMAGLCFREKCYTVKKVVLQEYKERMRGFDFPNKSESNWDEIKDLETT